MAASSGVPTELATKVEAEEPPLQKLIHGVPMLALTINVALLAAVSQAATGGNLAAMKNSPTTSIFFTTITASASFAMSSITFLPSVPGAAAFFQHLSLFFFSLASASAAASFLHGWYVWFTYATCVVQLLPFVYTMCQWMYRRLWPLQIGILDVVAWPV